MENPNAELIAGLRALADFLESRTVTEVASQTIHIFVDSKAEFTENLRQFGTAEKDASGNWFFANKHFGRKVELKLCAERQKVCERVKVGERVVAATPERTLPAEPERIEEVYEWKCPGSVLKN